VKPLCRFVPLDKASHDRVSLDCGVEELNTFLHRHAGRGMDAGVSYTWVLRAAGASGGEKKGLCAFYALWRCAQLSQRGKVPSVAVVVDVPNDAALHFMTGTRLSGRCIPLPRTSAPDCSFP